MFNEYNSLDLLRRNGFNKSKKDKNDNWWYYHSNYPDFEVAMDNKGKWMIKGKNGVEASVKSISAVFNYLKNFKVSRNSKISSELIKIAKLLVSFKVPLSKFKGLEKNLIHMNVGEDSDWQPAKLSKTDLSKSHVLAGFINNKPEWIMLNNDLYVNKGGRFVFVKGYKTVKGIIEGINNTIGAIGDVYSPSLLKVKSPKQLIKKKNKMEIEEEQGGPTVYISKENLIKFINSKIKSTLTPAVKVISSELYKVIDDMIRAVSSSNGKLSDQTKDKVRTISNKISNMGTVNDLITNVIGQYEWEKDKKFTMQDAKYIQSKFDDVLTGRW